MGTLRYRIRKMEKEQGAVAVEFALLLPALLLLIVGMIQFGIIFNYYISVTHAAREGVRWAALHHVESEVQQKAIDAAPSLKPPLVQSDITVSNPAPTIEDQGEPVTVTVSYQVPIDVPFMDSFFPGGYLTLVTKATQRIE